MAKIYEGELFVAKGGERKFAAHSSIWSISFEDIKTVLYEMISPNIGKEMFTGRLFPLVISSKIFEDKEGYINRSCVNAAAVILHNKERNLVGSKEYLKEYIEEFMDDPNYEQNLERLNAYADMNENISSGIKSDIRAKLDDICGLVKETVDVYTMSSDAKSKIKSEKAKKMIKK